jgi:hypothetical protein
LILSEVQKDAGLFGLQQIDVGVLKDAADSPHRVIEQSLELTRVSVTSLQQTGPLQKTGAETHLFFASLLKKKRSALFAKASNPGQQVPYSLACALTQ